LEQDPILKQIYLVLDGGASLRYCQIGGDDAAFSPPQPLPADADDSPGPELRGFSQLVALNFFISFKQWRPVEEV
jgi:hypothetical protein